jgi:hypothetical protein
MLSSEFMHAESIPPAAGPGAPAAAGDGDDIGCAIDGDGSSRRSTSVVVVVGTTMASCLCVPCVRA